MSCRQSIPKRKARKPSNSCCGGDRYDYESSESSSSSSSVESTSSDECECSDCDGCYLAPCDCYVTPQRRKGKGKTKSRCYRPVKTSRAPCSGTRMPRKKTSRRGKSSPSCTCSAFDSEESQSSDEECFTYVVSNSRRKTRA